VNGGQASWWQKSGGAFEGEASATPIRAATTMIRRMMIDGATTTEPTGGGNTLSMYYLGSLTNTISRVCCCVMCPHIIIA